MSVCWITGGGTGIGRALAEALCRRGDRVILSGRRSDVLESARRQIAESTPAPVLAIPGDVSRPEYIQRVVATAEGQWGPINLLINNAGVNYTHSFSEAALAEFRESFEINCLAAVACIQAVLPAMRARRSGAIVNISSVYGKWASARSASYSVAKYAMAGLTDALRQDLQGSGVHVLGVYPGFIRTPMTEPFVVKGSLRDRMGRSPEAMARVILQAIDRGAGELHFPWYVPWVLRLHRWFPSWSDRLAARVRR
ncbi:MAG TPA: SDR family oxidoreductase [Elusimicrobiota bacterium]|nr:SDR family oxidoreductase [Elusimicrobiota bacterium]